MRDLLWILACTELYGAAAHKRGVAMKELLWISACSESDGAAAPKGEVLP